jgi:hypothetical protein
MLLFICRILFPAHKQLQLLSTGPGPLQGPLIDVGVLSICGFVWLTRLCLLLPCVQDDVLAIARTRVASPLFPVLAQDDARDCL